MKKEEVTIGQLMKTNDTWRHMLELCLTDEDKMDYMEQNPQNSRWIEQVPVARVLPKLEKIFSSCGVGFKSVANFRERLKKIGYTVDNCPFLRCWTKTAAREKIRETLKYRKLTDEQFELIWEIVEKHFWLSVQYHFND